MKKLLSKNIIWVMAGIVACLLSCLPYFLLREESIVTYQDRLAGDITRYVDSAKYLLNGSGNFIDKLSGMSGADITTPAPAFVLLFMVLDPFWAYVATLVIVKLVGFIGTYLLIREITEKKWLAFLCGVGFILLPFYVMHGLCIPGEPLLLYAILKLRSKTDKPYKYWLFIAIYAACSSLQIVGFAWICFLVIAYIVAFFRRKNITRYFFAMAICVGVYAAENIGLIKHMISTGTVYDIDITVRSESLFIEGFWTAFGFGTDYTDIGQLFFLPAIAFAFAMYGLFKFAYKNKSDAVTREVKYLSVGLGINITLALLYALYNIKPVVDFCDSAEGIIRDFDFGRIVWIMPVIWIAMLGMSLSILWDLFVSILDKKKTSIFAKMIRFAIWIVYMSGVLATVGFFAVNGYMDSELKYNVSKMFNNDNHMMTWEEFSEDYLAQAEIDSSVQIDSEQEV